MREPPSAVIAAVLVPLLALTACGGSSPDGGGGGDKSEPTLGYSTKHLSDSFMALLQKQTLATAKKKGFHTLPPINANLDSAKQFTDIRSLVSQGAKALIVIPADGKAVLPAMKFAKSRDIPVVTIDDAPSGGGAYMVVRAAVIGGVSLNGGAGSMFGAFTGVLLLGTISNILTLSNVPSFWIDASFGAIILCALLLSRFATGAKET